jgi:hypothetical protein
MLAWFMAIGMDAMMRNDEASLIYLNAHLSSCIALVAHIIMMIIVRKQRFIFESPTSHHRIIHTKIAKLPIT